MTVDVGPLRRSRDFRLQFFGQIVSDTGSQFTLIAVYLQVFALTHSAAAVGFVGLVQFVPLAFATILGGPIIDTHDRRKLLLVAQAGSVAASAVLFVSTTVGSPPLAVVYVGAALVALFGGFATSCRQTMIPNLVPPEDLPSAMSVNQVSFNTCLIAGPLIGGVVVSQLGFAWAYGIDLVSFGAAITAACLMRPMLPRIVAPEGVVRAGAIAGAWHRVTEGFRYLRGRKVLQMTFYADIVAMVFGMPRALFPILAVSEFHGGSETVGLLFSAVSVGALLGALTAGWVRRVDRQGLAVVWAIAIWGAGIVAFGLAGGRLVVAVVCLAVAGGADMISAVFRGTMLQSAIPDNLRGRISAVRVLVVAGGPRIGDVEAGLVASAFSPTVSVVSGGAICIVGVALLALAVPEFSRYRASTARVAPA